MATYNQVIQALNQIAENHRQINTFGFGDIWEIATSGDILYPMMWVDSEGVDIDLTAKSETYKFSILFMDAVKNGEVNETEVLSDQLSIAEDILAQLRHPSYPWTFDGSSTLEDFTERFVDSVSGWKITVSLKVPFSSNRCSMPFDGNTSFPTFPSGGSGGATSGVTSLIGVSGRTTVTPGSTGDLVVDIDSAYVGQTSITTLGTITTGVWNGTTISNTYTQAHSLGDVLAVSGNTLDQNIFSNSAYGVLGVQDTGINITHSLPSGDYNTVSAGVGGIISLYHNSSSLGSNGYILIADTSLSIYHDANITLQSSATSQNTLTYLDSSFNITSIPNSSDGYLTNDGFGGFSYTTNAQLTAAIINPTSGKLTYNNSGAFADSLFSQSGTTMSLAGQLTINHSTAGTVTFGDNGNFKNSKSTNQYIEYNPSVSQLFLVRGMAANGTSGFRAELDSGENFVFETGAGRAQFLTNGFFDLYVNYPTSGNPALRIDSSSNAGIGTGGNTISARLHLISTTEQLRVGFDLTNYMSLTVSSAGKATFTPTGTALGNVRFMQGVANVDIGEQTAGNGAIWLTQVTNSTTNYALRGNGAANTQLNATTSLILSTANTGRVTITSTTLTTTVNVGVGATPTSSLHVTGSFATAYVAKTANYTATISDHTIDCTANSFTVTLPTAVGITGRIYVIKNSTGGSTITAATTSSQTIDGITTQSITGSSAMVVQSNGANWIII